MTSQQRTLPGREDQVAALGIDLGTTRTVVAVSDRSNYPVLPFTDGEGDDHFYLPSVSALTPAGLVHGFRARQAARQGAPLLRSLKRLLASPRTTWSTPVRLGGQELAVGEVLTSYLRHLREEIAALPALAEVDLAAATTSVVVAVPAHAYGAQRMLTRDAFEAAGFHVTAVVNEPSAAGLEYTHRRSGTLSSRRTRVLVYDLGGGTFDSSVVDVTGGRHEVLASRGLPDLGGDDVDLLLAQMVLERCGTQEEDLSPTELDDLLEQCQEAKEGLTPQTRRVVVELRGQSVVVDTAEIYRRCAPLVARSLAVMEPLLSRLDDGSPDLSHVAGIYLVGGASAFPPVARALRERYGRRVHRSPYPGSSTAIGLAIAADPQSGLTLSDRLSRGFGVFRESENGERTSFDVLLRPDSVQAGAGQATVIEREYQAVHNVARFRFVECADIDERGEPCGRTYPYQDVLFPLEAGLRDHADLRQVEVRRTGNGPRVHERYEVDADGQIQVTLTDISDGYRRRYVLGQRQD